jgi:hypothetical protein
MSPFLSPRNVGEAWCKLPQYILNKLTTSYGYLPSPFISSLILARGNSFFNPLPMLSAQLCIRLQSTTGDQLIAAYQ